MGCKVALVVFCSFVFARVGPAFPEMGRLGYSSCQSCHISPTGGGNLTQYGKSVADDFLGTWSYPGASQNLFGLADTPAWLDIGGDIRTIRLQIDTGETPTPPPRTFLMQSDLEIALHAGPRISVAGSWGYYGIPLPVNLLGDEAEPESRRYYVIIKPYHWISLRAGKFLPAYGLMIPDHTVNIRAGLFWPQGSETLNTEIGLWQEWGEVVATHSIADPLSGTLASDTLRASVYLGKSYQVGISGHKAESASSVGLFTIAGITKKLFILAEADYKTTQDTQVYQLWATTGLELFKSFIVLVNGFATIQETSTAMGFGYGFQWFPFPHFELLAKIESLRNDRGHVSTYVLMGHYYL
jgi:hypothetical protein